MMEMLGRRDVHMHLERGSYSKDWVEKYVQKAQKEEIEEIWILEHTHRFEEFLPMYRSLEKYGTAQMQWVSQKGRQKLKDYLELIEQMRKETFATSIKWGLEVCYFPGQERFVEKEMKNLGLDFLVGSVHWIDGFGFDQRPELWEGKEVNQVYKRYYEIMKELIVSQLFDGLAHPDSIKCYGHIPEYNLAETYFHIANLLNANNMYTEESSGLYTNYNYPVSGMNQEMLCIMKEKNVRIELASDAHLPEHVGNQFRSMETALNP